MSVFRKWRGLGPGLAAVILAPVLAACGPGTGEGASAASASAAPVTAPATQVAASAAAPAPAKVFLSVIGDTVRAGAGLTADEKPWLDCAQANRFPIGSTAVFRFKVVDPLTAQPLDDTQMKSVILTMGNNLTQEMKFIGRPTTNPTDHFWRYVWKIPDGYPTGQLNYKVDAVDLKGRTGTFSEFTVKPSQVVIVAAGTR